MTITREMLMEQVLQAARDKAGAREGHEIYLRAAAMEQYALHLLGKLDAERDAIEARHSAEVDQAEAARAEAQRLSDELRSRPREELTDGKRE